MIDAGILRLDLICICIIWKCDYTWLWKYCCETVMIMCLLIYTSIVCVWRNSMSLMRRFYGGVILVYAF